MACMSVNTFACFCCLFSLCSTDIAGLQQPDGSFWGDEWGEVRACPPLLLLPAAACCRPYLLPPLAVPLPANQICPGPAALPDTNPARASPHPSPQPQVDTRFSYCALSALWLLDRLDAIDVPAAAAYVASCKNFDGGFGCTPGGVPGHMSALVCTLLTSIS